MSKIRNILKFAMRMEKDAEDFYTYYADKAESESTRQLFQELAAIEKYHYEILSSKFEELGFEDPPLTISWVVDNTFSSRDPHILSSDSDLSADAENGLSDLNIIRMAYLIENDFSLFYKNAIDIVDEAEAKEFLKTLSEWENVHREMFYERYQDLLKNYWGDMASLIFP